LDTKWTQDQYLCMENGGNGKILSYFKTHGIDKLSVEKKYTNHAATQYKKQLKKQVDLLM
jgi:hypothetical protein